VQLFCFLCKCHPGSRVDSCVVPVLPRRCQLLDSVVCHSRVAVMGAGNKRAIKMCSYYWATSIIDPTCKSKRAVIIRCINISWDCWAYCSHLGYLLCHATGNNLLVYPLSTGNIVWSHRSNSTGSSGMVYRIRHWYIFCWNRQDLRLTSTHLYLQHNIVNSLHPSIGTHGVNCTMSLL